MDIVFRLSALTLAVAEAVVAVEGAGRRILGRRE